MTDETPAMDTNSGMTAATDPGIEPQEIGHVVLRVRELSRSVPFYELLGFRKVAEIPGMMAFFTATGVNHDVLDVPTGAQRTDRMDEQRRPAEVTERLRLLTAQPGTATGGRHDSRDAHAPALR